MSLIYGTFEEQELSTLLRLVVLIGELDHRSPSEHDDISEALHNLLPQLTTLRHRLSRLLLEVRSSSFPVVLGGESPGDILSHFTALQDIDAPPPWRLPPDFFDEFLEDIADDGEEDGVWSSSEDGDVGVSALLALEQMPASCMRLAVGDSCCSICLQGEDDAARFAVLQRTALPERALQRVAEMDGSLCVRLRCEHEFHTCCLRQWATRCRGALTCPLCRSPHLATNEMTTTSSRNTMATPPAVARPFQVSTTLFPLSPEEADVNWSPGV